MPYNDDYDDGLQQSNVYSYLFTQFYIADDVIRGSGSLLRTLLIIPFPAGSATTPPVTVSPINSTSSSPL